MSVPPKPGIYFPGGLRQSTNSMPRKALFMDRDGVINVNHGYVHTAEQTDWVPGIFELCATARDAGYALIVVTNQAGIARGYYSEADFLDYTRWMHGEFAERGLEILATLYCPHHPDAGLGALRTECNCRKPAPGLFLAAIERFDLSPDDSVMIGDKESDLIAASRAGVSKAFLVESNKPESFVEVIRYFGLLGDDMHRDS